MAQTKALIQALKSSLKAHGKTYIDVAEHLNLSEASVKRLFSEQNLSLARLDSVCQMMGMEISDLVAQMSERENKRFLSQLEWDQEVEIAKDKMLILVTVTVLNRWTIEDILEAYKVDEHLVVQKLATLDRLKIIDLLPKNKIKLLVAPNFSWIKNGPIQQFFLTQIQSDFFQSRFEHKAEKLVVLNGTLSKSSDSVFQRKMEKLAQEFEELNSADASLPIGQRQPRTVILAIRPWAYDVYSEIL